MCQYFRNEASSSNIFWSVSHLFDASFNSDFLENQNTIALYFYLFAPISFYCRDEKWWGKFETIVSASKNHETFIAFAVNSEVQWKGWSDVEDQSKPDLRPKYESAEYGRLGKRGKAKSSEVIRLKAFSVHFFSGKLSLRTTGAKANRAIIKYGLDVCTSMYNFGFLIKNVSWHLCEIYSVQCVYGLDLASLKSRGEMEVSRRTAKIAQHKYTLNGVTAVEHVEIERSKKKVCATKSLYHSWAIFIYCFGLLVKLASMAKKRRL